MSGAFSPAVGQDMPTASSYHVPSLASTSSGFNLPGVTTSVLVIVASLLVLEQTVYRYKKGNLPGDRWSIPLIGRFADSLNPTLENYQRGWVFPLSAVSVFNMFIVMASSNEYARKILTSAEYAEPCLVASAKQILSPDNWVFSHGKVHQEFRKGLNILFTRRALSQYLKTQDSVYRKYFAAWMADGDAAKPYMFQIRDLNMDTSLRVFCGDYIPAHGGAEITENYWLITRAMELVNFPFAFPGTKVYKAIQARKLAQKWFEHTAAESKKRMLAGEEPGCLTDEWVKEMVVTKKAEEAGEEHKGIRWFTDREIAFVILSFLFASQDAMSSAVTYIFQHLADHPEVFHKVREEQLRVRNNDVDASMTLEHLDEMPYTRAVVKESLRIKPPVLMVPYLTIKPFPISDTYTVPKGTMCIPSFWNSLMDPEAYPEPEKFLPERWLPGGVSEKSPVRNFLVFGAGVHRCIGYDYAMMHIAAVTGTATMLMDWDHVITPDSDKVKIIATIFPKDDLVMKFRPANLALEN